MGVIFNAEYRRQRQVQQPDGTYKTVNISVPAPVFPESLSTPWWYDHVTSQLNDLATAGFTAVLLPPVHKAWGGTAQGTDGYGVYDDYDIGNKNQQGGIPTRFGSREQLQRLAATVKANGMDLYVNWVAHQRMGGNNGTYVYKGQTVSGRFPKSPSCFYGKKADGYVDRDPIAGPVADDNAFGDELCPVNALPKGYVQDGLNQNGSWLLAALDGDGARLDDTKGQAFSAVRSWINYGKMKGRFFVGEYSDGIVGPQVSWVDNMQGKCSSYDFPLHYHLRDMCNNASNYDMRQLLYGLFQSRPLNSVTFVENPDTDVGLNSQTIWNKILAYAVILTSEGYPMVYYKDYSTDAECYGLKKYIDNLVWIHEKLASGPTIKRYVDYQYLIYERTGGKGLVVGINNDTYNSHGQWVKVNGKPGTWYHDYSGNNKWDQQVNADGYLYVEAPANNNGHSYVCYAPAGQDSKIAVVSQYTIQRFEGANDLDIGPAPVQFQSIMHISCAAKSYISFNLIGTCSVRFLDDTGNSINLSRPLDKDMTVAVQMESNMRSPSTLPPFTLDVTYKAPTG